MMQKSDFTRWLPYIGSLLIFLILSVAYVHPVLEGKRLLQSDIVKFEGMAKEIKDFREEKGEQALWTNSMFGGMPAFQISVIYKNNIARYINRVFTLGLPRPADMIFLYFAGFFIFLLLMKVNVWIAFLGALAFAFSSYHFIIIEAGHNSKALAIGYMAPVMASVIYTFRGHYFSGSLLFALFLALQLFSNHLQITYYLLMIVIIWGIAHLIKQYRENQLPHFFKSVLFLLAAAIIAIGLNFSNFWSTYVYASETMRGGTQLVNDERQNKQGLDPEYITAWSYGIEETLSLLVPNAKGGASEPLLYDELIAMNQGAPAERREAAEVINQYDRSFINFIIEQLQSQNYVNKYWGNQPFTSGPVYFGAVVLFLFVLGLFYLKGPLKWGFIAAIILSVMLAWGKNFQFFTDFFINYVPGYNKFRAVSMTLVIAEFLIPAIAFLGMAKWYQNPGLLKVKSRPFYWAFGATAGLLALLYVMPGAFLDFLSETDQAIISASEGSENDLRSHFAQVVQIRKGIFRQDVARSLMFVLLTASAVGLYVSGKMNKPLLVALLAVLIVSDMWPINKRYFDHSSFVPSRQIENPYQPTQANLEILKDNDTPFRVYNVTVSSFNDASTSYFHHSVGGYHGAKLQRFQEVIDQHIANGNDKVLNMLNTRYFIVQGNDQQPSAVFNADALGNAWFVNDIQWVENADEEIQALHDFNPASTAVVNREFNEHLDDLAVKDNNNGFIELTDYQPNRLIYQSESDAAQFAVFSEIYYPHGWKAFINGEPAEHIRVNYILRGMKIPAGQNEIEFRFEPASFYTGEKISLAFSLLFVLLSVAYIGKRLKPLLVKTPQKK
ncbi:MAG: YfhO family protein [Bacteroidales bacterium]